MKFYAVMISTAMLLCAVQTQAAERAKFVVKSPRWGAVQFSFNGTKACATNQGETMCGTASKVPKPGEAFSMRWNWPQKDWKRP